MHIIFSILLLCLLSVSTQQQIDFSANETSIVFHANWVEDIHALQEHTTLLGKHIEKEGLEVIDLSFTYCTHHQFVLQHIFKYKLKANSISINLDSCPVGIQGLTHILASIDDSLQELTLGLNSLALTEEFTSLLGKTLSQLKLKKVSLHLMFNKLGDNGLNQLFKHSLRSNLQQLFLDLTFNKLTPNALSNLSHFLHLVQPQGMRKVVIKLGSNKIEQKGSQFLYSALKRFNNLQVLDVDLYFNNVKAKGTTHISNLIKQQTGLKQLAINLDLNYIETQGGKVLGQALANLKHLQSLWIGVANKNFGLNGFLEIASQLGQLTTLKSLTLKAGINRIGLKGIERLAQALSKLTLQYLDLGFTENFITDQGFEVISKAISQQQGIRSLKLNLGFNEARTYGPINLCKALSRKDYKELMVGLSNNPLQDKDIKLMIPLFQSMIRKNDQFELQLLETKISEQLSKQIRGLFDSASRQGHRVAIHINSNEETTRIREQLEERNKQQQSQL